MNSGKGWCSVGVPAPVVHQPDLVRQLSEELKCPFTHTLHKCLFEFIFKMDLTTVGSMELVIIITVLIFYN